jgi:hypothetical protein
MQLPYRITTTHLHRHEFPNIKTGQDTGNQQRTGKEKTPTQKRKPKTKTKTTTPAPLPVTNPPSRHAPHRNVVNVRDARYANLKLFED